MNKKLEKLQQENVKLKRDLANEKRQHKADNDAAQSAHESMETELKTLRAELKQSHKHERDLEHEQQQSHATRRKTSSPSSVRKQVSTEPVEDRTESARDRDRHLLADRDRHLLADLMSKSYEVELKKLELEKMHMLVDR
jgi:hypothetical protein